MDTSHLSWSKYSAGKNLPKLMTIQDILKRQVDIEAEKLVELPPIEIPKYFIMHNIVKNPTGMYAFFSKILP